MIIFRTIKNTPQFASWVSFFVLVLYLALNCSAKGIVPSLNYDDGWLKAINYLTFSNFVPGRDYTFTYGPLDFIVHCVKEQPNEFWASCFFIFQYLATGWALWFYRKLYSPWNFVLFSIALIMAGFAVHGDRRTPAGDDYYPLLTLIMLLSVSKKTTGKTMIFSAILSALFGAIISFTKFDVSIFTALTIFFHVLANMLVVPKNRNNSALIICITYVICSLAIVWKIFQGPINAVHWVLNVLSLSGAYKDFWGYDSPNKTLFFFGSITLLIFIYLAILAFKKKDELASIMLVLMPSLLLGFMHGFLIEDIWHILSFLKYVLVVSPLLLLYSNRPIYVCVLLPLFFVTMQLTACGDNIERSWWNQSEKPSRLQSLKLPSDFFSAQTKDKNPVFYDAVPSNIMWCFANNLPYKPNPYLTLSLATSPVLDKTIADYFLGPNAANFLFCEFFAFAHKHMFFETPSAWRALLFGYSLEKYSDQKQVMLLKKNSLYEIPALSPTTSFRCQPKIWYKVPHSLAPLYCSLNFELTPLGKLYQLFKAPELFINVRYRNGQFQRFRASATGSSGLLINYLPQDLAALKDLFLKRCTNDVTDFELSGDGLFLCKQPIDCQWFLDKHFEVQLDLRPDPYPNKNLILNDDHKRFSITDLVTTRVLAKNVNNLSAVNFSHYLRMNPNTLVFLKDKDELIDFSYAVLDNQTPISAEQVFLQVDQSPMIKMASRRLLYDEAGLLQTREMLTGGFAVAIKASSLKSGLHTVTLIVQGQDGHFYRVNNATTFFTD